MTKVPDIFTEPVDMDIIDLQKRVKTLEDKIKKPNKEVNDVS